MKLDLRISWLLPMFAKTVVGNHQSASWLERVEDFVQHGLVISKVVVRVHNQGAREPVRG